VANKKVMRAEAPRTWNNIVNPPPQSWKYAIIGIAIAPTPKFNKYFREKIFPR
jgi:hypothetical protein